MLIKTFPGNALTQFKLTKEEKKAIYCCLYLNYPGVTVVSSTLRTKGSSKEGFLFNCLQCFSFVGSLHVKGTVATSNPSCTASHFIISMLFLQKTWLKNYGCILMSVKNYGYILSYVLKSVVKEVG